MRRKIYRAVVIVTIIACAAMAFLSWYTMGVIEKSKISEMLEFRVNHIAETIDSRKLEFDNINQRIYEDYKSKARALGLIFSQNSDLMKSETALEELRMITGAEVISIINSENEIEYTTGSESGEQKIYDEFAPALSGTVFSDVILDKQSDNPKIIAGCSRLDEKGIIQVEFSSENVENILELSDISKMFNYNSILKTGCIALIDKEKLNYISHTNINMVGKPSFFSLEEDFDDTEENKNFDCEISGEEVMLQYADTPMGIVIGYVPYKEIYETRDGTIKWILSAAILISFVITLTIRNKILHINKKKNPEN